MASAEGSCTFGQWLRTWRTAKGLSIKGAAQLAGWRPQFWSNLEQEARTRKGGLPPKPDERTVEIIANVLNIRVDVAMLAAGHAPAELQAAMCSYVPTKQGEAHFNPEHFNPELSSNLFVMCSACHQSFKLKMPDDIPTTDEPEKLLRNLPLTDIHWEEVIRRLNRMEDNIEKIVFLFDGLDEIKTPTESVRHTKLETTEAN